MNDKRDWASDRCFLVRNAWWAMGSLWLALALWAFLNGPRLRAEAAHEAGIAAEFEDRDVCRHLAMPFGSEGYRVCASELDGVRQRQKERMERHAAELL